MPDNIFGFHKDLTQGGNILDRYAVDESPKGCGLGRQPRVVSDYSFNLLCRKPFLKPCEGFGISQLQNPFDCVFGMGGGLERLRVDVPEKGRRPCGIKYMTVARSSNVASPV
jgi:hypothetical protein